MADIHAGFPRCFQQLAAEQIVAHAADHGDLGPQAGALQRLIGAFSAGGHVKGFSVNCLGRGGDPLRGGDDIHDKAAHD